MSTDSPNVFNDALALPEDQRAILAFQLLQSLKPPAIMDVDDSTLDFELDRRMAAYDAGATNASNWHDASQRLRAALDNRQTS